MVIGVRGTLAGAALSVWLDHLSRRQSLALAAELRVLWIIKFVSITAAGLLRHWRNRNYWCLIVFVSLFISCGFAGVKNRIAMYCCNIRRVNATAQSAARRSWDREVCARSKMKVYVISGGNASSCENNY